MTTKTICILGSTGRVGHCTAKAFSNAGWHVIAVSRAGKTPGLPATVEHRAGDAMYRSGLVKACAGADVIFNALNPVYTDWAEQVPPMTDNVIAAAKATGAVHLFIGNVYNYGPEIAHFCDENTPQLANTGKGLIRRQMEDRFAEASREGVKTIVLRAGDFYGAGRGAWFDLEITKRLNKGIFTYPGALDLPHSFAYLPDLAATFVMLADILDTLGAFETFTFPGHTMTGNDLKRHCEAALGRALKVRRLPLGLLRLAGLFSPMMREVHEVAYLWQRPHALKGDKLKSALGEIPCTEPSTAVERALAELGFNPAPKRSRLRENLTTP